MFKSATHTVFATPELVSLLFAYLTPHDLTQSIRVCKQWMQHIEPILWKILCCGGCSRTKLSPETTAGLIRNLPHIRTVDLTWKHLAVLQELAHGQPPSLQTDNSAVVPNTSCTHLRRLKIEDWSESGNWAELYSKHILILRNVLVRNLRLTHLTIPLPNVTIGDPVLAAISHLKHLQSFTVSSSRLSLPAPTLTISLLLQACLPLPKLTELCVDLNVLWCNEEEDMGVCSLESIIKEAAKARFSEISTPGKIKSLRLPIAHGPSGNPLSLPLLRSGLLDLESCTVFSFAKDLQPDDIARIVREYCPNLKHLRCVFLNDSRKDYWLVPAFVRGCSKLQSFTSHGFCDSGLGFRNFFESQIIRDLVSHHWDTLENIELESCEQFLSSHQQTVLSRCEQLRRYHVTGKPVYRYMGFKVEDVLKGEWVCTELRVLRITLFRSDSRSRDATKRFYRQIRRLRELEQLALEGNRRSSLTSESWEHTWDLTLSKGCLSELADLKKLKSFSLGVDFWTRMKQPEVEFMHDHWPRLCEIEIAGKDVSRVRERAHWQWLFNQRPHLWFTAQERSYPWIRVQITDTVQNTSVFIHDSS